MGKEYEMLYLAHVSDMGVIFGILTVVFFLGAVVLGWLAFKWRSLLRELERHALATEQSSTLWVDYHLKPKHLIVSGDLEKISDRPVIDMMGDEVYDVFNLVDEKATPFRTELRRFLESGGRYFKTKVRVKKKNGEYAWFSMMGTRVNENWFVGQLNDVDTQITQEKVLTERAENDLLTGILNKKTMESRITAALQSRKENQNLIFFMVDLDNFKTVNDTLGHIYGDKVLVDAAEKLKKVFQHDALIGRLGGDEFAVCATFEAFDNDNLQEYIRSKGKQLCETMREDYICDDLGVSVSASIGIASAPLHGEDFDSIYQRADKALYLSKRSGKNQYNVFELKETE